MLALCAAGTLVLGGCALPTRSDLPDGSQRVPVNAQPTQEALAMRAQVAAMQREVAALRTALETARVGGQRSDDGWSAGVAKVSSGQRMVRGAPTRDPLMQATEAGLLGVVAPYTPRSEIRVFEFTAQDRDMASCLRRWGEGYGYEVLWESDIAIPLDARAVGRRLTALDFKGALVKTLDGLQQLGYPLKALIYTDQVVRIVNKEQDT
jgi:hypothetical protein